MKADVKPRPTTSSAAAIAAGDVLLSIENVSLSFGGVKALRNVSFDIRTEVTFEDGRKGVVEGDVAILDVPAAAPLRKAG